MKKSKTRETSVRLTECFILISDRAQSDKHQAETKTKGERERGGGGGAASHLSVMLASCRRVDTLLCLSLRQSRQVHAPREFVER